MPLKNFIKENFVLVVGLALPVLLVVLFFAASVMPKAMVAPPQYEMLYLIDRYNGPNEHYNVDLFIKDGVVKARVWENPNRVGMVSRKKLMAYDGKTQTVREIPYDLSKIGDVPNMSEISLDEFKNMKVSGSSKSPDGYEFENGGYSSGGMVTDIFGGGYRSGIPRVVKGSAVFKIPTGGNDFSGYGIQFLGWIIQK